MYNLVVPINEQGIYDYENDVSKIDNLKCFDFPVDEFNFLLNNGIIDKYNLAFDIMIDEFEEDIIENKYLLKAKEIIIPYRKNVPNFYKALEFAIHQNTELCLEC
ncbi:MAG: hypothetical protein PUG48_06580 [Clostridia bacterium]|nr:hypothetical protein [Clostridia bacterium]